METTFASSEQNEQQDINGLLAFIEITKKEIFSTISENPYHNEIHAAMAVWKNQKILEMVKSVGVKFLQKEELLMCAALWAHDADHLGGTAAHDAENIKRAQAFVQRLNEKVKILRQELVDEINKLIGATLFPGEDYEITSLSEVIIQMSDIASGGLFKSKEEFLEISNYICRENGHNENERNTKALNFLEEVLPMKLGKWRDFIGTKHAQDGYLFDKWEEIFLLWEQNILHKKETIKS